MAPNASKVLGADQLASAIVNRRNTAKMTVAGVAGVVVGSAILGKMDVDKAETPSIGQVALLVLTENDIALVNMRQGFPGLRMTGKIAARVPHSSVASIELGKGTLASPLTIVLTDGATWILEVRRGETKRAKKLIAFLDELRAPES
jgi:hypothetical protein